MTGSLFLLAVAVICLPMLLDGAGLPARQLPDMAMDDALPAVQPLASQVPRSDYVDRVQRLRGEVDDQGFLTDNGTRFGEPVLTAGDRPAATTPNDSTAAGDSAEDHRRTAGGSGDGTDAWAVQVASFSRAANAEDFRSRLREDGYEAFISTAKIRGQVLSRVAVGPLLDRRRAETLRGELASRYQVRARLMAFAN